MAVRIVRLGTPRARGEGLRIGTVRRPPRGVRKQQYAARDFFDVWLPDLAPSQALVPWVMAAPLTPKRWAASADAIARKCVSRRLDAFSPCSQHSPPRQTSP